MKKEHYMILIFQLIVAVPLALGTSVAFYYGEHFIAIMIVILWAFIGVMRFVYDEMQIKYCAKNPKFDYSKKYSQTTWGNPATIVFWLIKTVLLVILFINPFVFLAIQNPIDKEARQVVIDRYDKDMALLAEDEIFGQSIAFNETLLRITGVSPHSWISDFEGKYGNILPTGVYLITVATELGGTLIDVSAQTKDNDMTSEAKLGIFKAEVAKALPAVEIEETPYTLVPYSMYSEISNFTAETAKVNVPKTALELMTLRGTIYALYAAAARVVFMLLLFFTTSQFTRRVYDYILMHVCTKHWAWSV